MDKHHLDGVASTARTVADPHRDAPVGGDAQLEFHACAAGGAADDDPVGMEVDGPLAAVGAPVEGGVAGGQLGGIEAQRPDPGGEDAGLCLTQHLHAPLGSSAGFVRGSRPVVGRTVAAFLVGPLKPDG